MFYASIYGANEDILQEFGVGHTEKSSFSVLTWTVINLYGSKDWLPENMAFDNNDIKSMDLPLIILSLSCAGTADRDTGGLWVVLSRGLLAAVNEFSVMFVCRLSIVAIGGKGGLPET